MNNENTDSFKATISALGGGGGRWGQPPVKLMIEGVRFVFAPVGHKSQ